MSVVNERVHGYEFEDDPEELDLAVEPVEITLEEIKRANKDINRVLNPTIIQRRIDASTEILTQSLPLAQVGAATSIALLGGMKISNANAAIVHRTSEMSAIVVPLTHLNPLVSAQTESKLVFSKDSHGAYKSNVQATQAKTAPTLNSKDYQSERLKNGQNIWDDVAAIEKDGKASKGQVAEVAASEKDDGVDKIAAERHETDEDAAQQLPDGFWVKMMVKEGHSSRVKVATRVSAKHIDAEHEIVVEPGECAGLEAEQHDETLAKFIKQNHLEADPNLIDAYSLVKVDSIGTISKSTSHDISSSSSTKSIPLTINTPKAVTGNGGAGLSTTSTGATTKASAKVTTPSESKAVAAPAATPAARPTPPPEVTPVPTEANPVAPIEPTKSYSEKSSIRAHKDIEHHKDDRHHHTDHNHKKIKHEHHHKHRHLSSTSTRKIVLNVSSRVGHGISTEGQHSLQEAVARAGKKTDVSPDLIASFYYAENERRDDTNTDASSASIAVAGDGVWRDPAAPFGHGASWNSNIYTAAGPWQFITSTWNEYKMPGMNDTSSRNNLDSAALVAGRYLHSLLQAAGTNDFDNPGPGKILYAGYGYNHSSTYAQSILNTYDYIGHFHKAVAIKHIKDAYAKSGTATKDPSPTTSTQTTVRSSDAKHHDKHDHHHEKEHKKKHHHDKRKESNKISSTMIGKLIVKDAYRYNGASYEEDATGQNYGSIWHTWFHAESNGNYGPNAEVDCVGMASNNVLWDLFGQNVDNSTWSLYPNSMYKEVPFTQVQPGDLIEPEQYGAQAWNHAGGHVEIVTEISGDNIYTFGAHDNDVAQPEQVDNAYYDEASDPENMFLEYVGPHKLTSEGKDLLSQIKEAGEPHDGNSGVVKLSSTGPTNPGAPATTTSTTTAQHHRQAEKANGEGHKHGLGLANHIAIHAVKHAAEKTIETAKHDEKSAATRVRVRALHANHAVARKRAQAAPAQEHHAARQHIRNINQRLGHHSVKGAEVEVK